MSENTPNHIPSISKDVVINIRNSPNLNIGGDPGTIYLFVQLASLPVLGLALRNLASSPAKLGAYLPAIVAGFVQGLTTIENARTELQAAKAHRKAELLHIIDTEETSLHGRAEAVVAALEPEINRNQTRLDTLTTLFADATDEQTKARLADEVARVTADLEIKRALLDEVRRH